MVKDFGHVPIDCVALCPAKTTMEDDIVKDVRRDHNNIPTLLKQSKKYGS